MLNKLTSPWTTIDIHIVNISLNLYGNNVLTIRHGLECRMDESFIQIEDKRLLSLITRTLFSQEGEELCFLNRNALNRLLDQGFMHSIGNLLGCSWPTATKKTRPNLGVIRLKNDYTLRRGLLLLLRKNVGIFGIVGRHLIVFWIRVDGCLLEWSVMWSWVYGVFN